MPPTHSGKSPTPIHQAALSMLRPVAIPEELFRGRLYLCSMPGRYAPLEEFLNDVATANMDHLVCLAPDDEIAEKSPEYLSAIREHRVPGELWRFDIPDYGIPDDVQPLEQLLDHVGDRLKLGESVVIHCAAGQGRTGMVAALLLVRMGMGLNDSINTVRIAGSAPDNRDQMEFLKTRAGVV